MGNERGKRLFITQPACATPDKQPQHVTINMSHTSLFVELSPQDAILAGRRVAKHHCLGLCLPCSKQTGVRPVTAAAE